MKFKTFRCPCTGRGEQCPVEFTRANAYTASLSELRRRYPRQPLTIGLLAAHAVCPIHAKLLGAAGWRVRPFEKTLAALERIRRESHRRDERERQAFLAREARREKFAARQAAQMAPSPFASKLANALVA